MSVQSVSPTFTTGKMRGLIELPRADHVKFVDIGELQSLANGDRQYLESAKMYGPAVRRKAER